MSLQWDKHPWQKIQAFYDEGHSREICRAKFNYGKHVEYRAIKDKKFIPKRTNIKVKVKHFTAQQYAEHHMGNKNDGTRQRIRQRILKERAIPYICGSCSLDPVWNNKPLTLTLDHKDGDSGNHSFDNLQFVCPNCDSQQNTYCYRNRKKKQP